MGRGGDRRGVGAARAVRRRGVSPGSQLTRARARGFVISDVVELPGVRTIAFPIFDKNKHPVAAISVATLSQRMDKGRSDLAISCITKAIEQIQPTLLTMGDED